MIKWLLKWLEGKPVPKYLSGKNEDAAKPSKKIALPCWPNGVSLLPETPGL